MSARGLAFLLLGAGVGVLALRRAYPKRPARTEAEPDESDWHVHAEPAALAYSGLVYLHDKKRRTAYTH